MTTWDSLGPVHYKREGLGLYITDRTTWDSMLQTRMLGFCTLLTGLPELCMLLTGLPETLCNEQELLELYATNMSAWNCMLLTRLPGTLLTGIPGTCTLQTQLAWDSMLLT